MLTEEEVLDKGFKLISNGSRVNEYSYGEGSERLYIRLDKWYNEFEVVLNSWRVTLIRDTAHLQLLLDFVNYKTAS